MKPLLVSKGRFLSARISSSRESFEVMPNSSASLVSISVAFKEWACVVRALGQGAQSLVIRKGGIHEDGGAFKPEHSWFALYPTEEHQQLDDLSSLGRQWLENFRSHAVMPISQKVTIEFAARVDSLFWIEKKACFERLAQVQCLNAQSLDKRFHYGERLGFTLMMVRVFRLKEKRLTPAQRGCKSWITLEPTMDKPLMEPVLSDAEFMKQATDMKNILGSE